MRISFISRLSFPRHFILAGMLAFLFAGTAAHAQEELLRSALASFGRDSSNVGYRPQPGWNIANPSDPFRLHWFDDMLARPLKIPMFTRDILWRYSLWLNADSTNFARPLIAKVRPLAGLVFNSARNLGYDIGKYGMDYTPPVAEQTPFVSAIRAIYTERGFETGALNVYPLPTQNWSDLEKFAALQASRLPAGLERTVAGLVEAVREAARWRDRSLQRIPRNQWDHIYSSTTLEESQCDALTFDQTVYDAALAFDGSASAWGSMMLAQAVEKAVPELQKYAGTKVMLDMPTPIGRIIISGSDKDVHYAQDCALLIDLGGDDTYLGAAAATSPSLPVSVVIDLGGDDRYLNVHEGTPAQGAGVLGIAMLLDLGGNDTYESRTFSQGCGRFGTGVLYDAGGKDSYVSLGFSQGAGLYGLGILFDRAGDDTYSTVYYAQGYGFAHGLGLLADLSGNDTYTADDVNLIHIGDETPKHNESDAQGYGAGRRGDHTDGHNMSGGLGILYDLAGDDTYSAGVFAQGTGYWYGMGVLADHAGNDSYRGCFFNLGAAAHYAIGVLFDDAGDDKTDLVMTLGLGTAHDASAAFYIDGDGDDTYTMSDGDDRACSLGSSLNNSFAVFANIRGNDRYAPVGNAFGYATGKRGGEWAVYAPGTGLFYDIGGSDTYAPVTKKTGFAPADGKTWRQQDDPQGGLHGFGIDTESGALRFEN